MERGNEQFLCPEFMPLSVFCPGSRPFQKEKQGKEGDRKARKWPGSWQTYSVKDKIVNVLGSVAIKSLLQQFYSVVLQKQPQAIHK